VEAPRVLLRFVVVACQALTIGITWPLWEVRASPPLLPWVPGVPQVPFGIVLLVTLAVVMARPSAGSALHLGALAAAIALDQTRMQPQVISLALLLLATLPSCGAALVGFAHLSALWLWSGLHKLASPGFYAGAGALVTTRFPGCPDALARTVVVAVALLEAALGVASLFRRTRRLARRAGAAFHLGVVVWLSPLGIDWNVSVWPWNVALAFAAWTLLAPDEPPARARFASAPRLARALALAELILPAGYEVGLVPAPFGHALYCLSEPHGTWLHADGRVTPMHELPELNVFLPGTYGALVAEFRARAVPGDRLVILEHRVLMRAFGRTETLLRQD
jgi:hypothetical protein